MEGLDAREVKAALADVFCEAAAGAVCAPEELEDAAAAAATAALRRAADPLAYVHTCGRNYARTTASKAALAAQREQADAWAAAQAAKAAEARKALVAEAQGVVERLARSCPVHRDKLALVLAYLIGCYAPDALAARHGVSRNLIEQRKRRGVALVVLAAPHLAPVLGVAPAKSEAMRRRYAGRGAS